MYLPTALIGEMNHSNTVVVTLLVLGAPIVLGFVIGRGYIKPDFWDEQLTLPSHLRQIPLPASTWVESKLKVAGLSALCSWFITMIAMTIWMGHVGELGHLYDWIENEVAEFSMNSWDTSVCTETNGASLTPLTVTSTD